MSKKRLGNYIQEYSVKNKKDLDYPVYSVTNSQGFCTEYFNKDVSGEDKTTYKIVPRGYFAYNPSRINVGSIDWQNCEDNVIVSPLYVVFKCSDELNQDYLKYYLKSESGKRAINASVSGSVRNNLKFSVLSNFELNIGSVDEQLAVVAKLKKIESAINNERNQLDLYKELIKTRFFELFGDPKTNTKNLKTRPLKEVLSLKAGDFTEASCISDERTEVNRYPCFGGNGIRGYVADYNQEGEYSLIGRQGALSGNVQYVKGRFKNTEHALLVTPIVEVNGIWLNQLLKALDLKRFQTGAAQPGLSVKNLQEIPIISVPIAEQKKFADVMCQIEKSTSEIHKRISLYKELLAKKTDELFNGESA